MSPVVFRGNHGNWTTERLVALLEMLVDLRSDARTCGPMKHLVFNNLSHNAHGFDVSFSQRQPRIIAALRNTALPI